MNLYLIEDDEADYDDVDACVVAAETEAEARRICSDAHKRQQAVFESPFRSKCTMIGVAVEGIGPGIIAEDTV